MQPDLAAPTLHESKCFWERLHDTLTDLDPLQRERVIRATLAFHDALESAGLPTEFDDVAKTWLTLVSEGVVQ
jgi:hypothetical protein